MSFSRNKYDQFQYDKYLKSVASVEDYTLNAPPNNCNECFQTNPSVIHGQFKNNSQLRKRFLNIVNPFLEQVQANSGLNAFKVVMDDSNNTPETIDRNMLVGQVFLQPARAASHKALPV